MEVSNRRPSLMEGARDGSLLLASFNRPALSFCSPMNPSGDPQTSPIPEAPLCPTHDILMAKTRIIYGLPDFVAVSRQLSSHPVIQGGCCADRYGEFGYMCPVDGEAYVTKNGRLARQADSDEGTDLGNSGAQNT
jgi:hypothetical protein